MRLIVCGSGSNGNTYLIESAQSCIVLDCGIKLGTVKKALDYKIMHIKFALCTHIHSDHMAYVKDYLKMGIKVLMPMQVKEKFASEKLAIALEPMKQIVIDDFKIIPFEVPHDTNVTCFGYLIEHSEFGKLLYLTDCMYCKYNFSKQGINHILIESNYSMDLVDRDEPNYEHRLRGHMSLDTALKFISTNDNPLLLNVVLIHLSDKSGNPALFTEETKKTIEYGANVYVARKGLEVNLNLCPF